MKERTGKLKSRESAYLELLKLHVSTLLGRELR